MTPNTAALASALHEIRTPIQTILGTTELLKATPLDSEQQEYVRQIAFSADVIYTLANDILDFEKLRTGNLSLEHIVFNPTNSIEQVLNLVSIEAYNKGIELLSCVHPEVPETILGDPLRLQQILLNMVKNAVKFTAKGYVKVELQKKDEQTLLFNIIDSGVGVPKDKKDSIFHPFTQASDSTTRQYGGSGLGLNICTQLINLMKGDLGVKDNPEGGSIFYFSIPQENLTENTSPRKLVNIPEGNRILVVDDSPHCLENISCIISQLSNIKISTASSGENALKLMKEAAIKQEEFSLVLIDMAMPSMDGWRLAAEINNDPSINGAKLYLMIPEGQLGGEAKMKLLSWFNGYLYKPLQRKKLVSLFEKAFDHPLELPSVEKADEHSNYFYNGQVTGNKITLPKTTETEQKATSPQKINEPPLSTTSFPSPVIAVDDHPVNLKILLAFLKSFGVEAYGAESGEEAISLAKEHPNTKLIFMDIEMPFMNGFQTSRKIRDNGYRGIIVACSANSTPDIIREYIQAGINDYLSKPFKKQHLADILTKWQTIPQVDTDGLWNYSQ